MCLIKVKEEEDYSVPARVVRRERRRSPPTERRSTRVSYVQPRQPSIERTYIIQAPAPPPAVVAPQSTRSLSPSPPPPTAAPEPRTQSHYVEVSPSSVSSSSSSAEDVRSRTTSKSRRTAPASEYHVREREYRREREQSPQHKDDYEHYRYVRAPQERSSHDRGGYGRDMSREGRTSIGGKTSFVEDPKASRTSYRRERERVVVVGNDGRQQREYRR